MAPIAGITSAAKALILYDRQQFYANRTNKIRAGRVYQVGVQDKVDISTEAMTRAAAGGQARNAGTGPEAPISYERPRRTGNPRQYGSPARRLKGEPPGRAQTAA